MKKFCLSLVLLLVMTAIFAGCSGEDKEANKGESTPEAGVTVNISAAASLTDALNEIKTEYAKESNDILQFNFGGSGALQKQIEEGAPCDLFISAAKSNMEALQTAGIIIEDSEKNLLGNSLTLIASTEKQDVVTLESLTKAEVGSIAVGTPESVPAGKYAMQAFEKLGIAGSINKKLVFAKDVRQVLEYVETGNADCGIVYKSDAMMMKTGKIIGDLEGDLCEEILYPAALIKDGAETEGAQRFYDFIQGEYAAKVFEKYGFTVI